MILNIHDNKTISEIQDKFTGCFPNLKIEFHNRPHHWKEGSLSADLITPDKKIGSIRKNHDPVLLKIKFCDKTGKIEKGFKEVLGLNVQIFRLEHNEWAQSTDTDNLTLAEQSEIAQTQQARVNLGKNPVSNSENDYQAAQSSSSQELQ